MISRQVNFISPRTIGLQIVDDLDHGEVKNFALVLVSPQVIALWKAIEVLIFNLLTVDIIDNDGR